MRKKPPKQLAPQPVSLERHFQNVAETESGVAVFQYLAAVCGFHLTSICENQQTKELDFNGTMFNEGRRSVYIHLRGHLPYNRLADIEIPPRKETLKDGDTINVS